MKRLPLNILLLVSLFSSAPVLATITTTSNAIFEVGGATIASDPKTGPPPGILSSSVNGTTADGLDVYGISGFGPVGPGVPYARAVNANGITAVAADGVFYDGQAQDHTMTASTTFSETVTNSTGGAADIFYDFSIFTPILMIADYAGASVGNAGAPTASFNIDISVGGSSVWSSSATLSGGFVGWTLTEVGVDLGAPAISALGSGNVIEAIFPSFSDTLLLGNLADGASLTYEVSMDAVASAYGFEIGGHASIGDPGATSGGTGMSGTIRSVSTGSGPGPGNQVPEPNILSLFALGLLGIGYRLHHSRKAA